MSVRPTPSILLSIYLPLLSLYYYLSTSSSPSYHHHHHHLQFDHNDTLWALNRGGEVACWDESNAEWLKEVRNIINHPHTTIDLIHTYILADIQSIHSSSSLATIH
eukprot:GHVU01057317.1.p2 GENE.GHVU01057317.1~~GHVU01057317.1.p2  ORF type:complete len:106 (-),score=17.49 GHVU01057317.1:748-1065(-)